MGNKLVVSIDEALYYASWYQRPGRRPVVTPRFVPPLQSGERPDVIPFRTRIHAQAIYLQPVEKERKSNPSIEEGPCKLLRPANSVALGPNTYVFVGEVVACDKYLLMPKGDGSGRRPRDKWSMKFILQCGLPLNFYESYTPSGDRDIGCTENYVRDGAYLEGIVRLSFSCLSTKTGLYQDVAGSVEGMEVLDMDPKSDSFGEIRDVAYGTKLNFDPDFLTTDTVFASLEVKETGPLSYGTIATRSPECPEPDYPNLIHTGVDDRVKIVEVNLPIPMRSANDAESSDKG